MKEEKVFIPSAGIQLEGLLSIQEASSFRGGVILCHPHPQYGGDMGHPVITTAAEAASQEGFSTLRFNFRGVGESGGSYLLFSHPFPHSALERVLQNYLGFEDSRVHGFNVFFKKCLCIVASLRLIDSMTHWPMSK